MARAKKCKFTIPTVSEEDFAAEVLRSNRPTLVVFGAPWSQPCVILKDALDEVAAQCGQAVRILRVNVDNHPDLGVWFGIESIPTLLCFVGGTVRARIVGTASKAAIMTRLMPLCTGT